ncbi:hypothetical protein [Sorangium cellulosum]|uniref:Uncharacterized protein n=1 Tax=Sorangium cellulosum TaxID=56 RepID=A0A150Q9W8_SORCE|nr:hypothetical protein [Sorangium cellulosum]KYF64546.1 hypothetical protein BE15_04580 [Sorangium cellulosum]
MLVAVLMIALLLGPCAPNDELDELWCDSDVCNEWWRVPAGGAGGEGGGWGGGGAAPTESSVSAGGGGAWGEGGAGEGGTGGEPTSGATTSGATTSSSTNATSTSSTGGPVGPTCGSDAACRYHTDGCYLPYCHECLAGRCVDGYCETEAVNDGVWGCIVTDEESPRHGKEGRCSAGTCLDFTPVRCQTDEGTFRGCDGTEHPTSEYVEIGFDPGPNQAEVECTGSARQVAYCPPGTFCVVRFAYDPVAGVERSIGGRCL